MKNCQDNLFCFSVVLLISVASFSTDGHSLRLGSVRDSPRNQRFGEELMGQQSPHLPERFTGTLEHVADILAQSRPEWTFHKCFSSDQYAYTLTGKKWGVIRLCPFNRHYGNSSVLSHFHEISFTAL